MHSAALFKPELLPYLLADYDELLGLQKKSYPYLALIWTTTFGVKGCFLTFMRPLVWHISRTVNRYYWFIVVFSIISWAFVIADPFILCPYFGADAVKCFSSDVNTKKEVGFTAFVTALDIISDIMVVSIPIIVLRGSFLSRSTKFGLAVMMASITAFRTLFVKQTNNSESETSRTPVESFFRMIFRRFQTLARAQPEGKPTPRQDVASVPKLPKIPSPIFTGLRSFIRNNNRTNATAATFVSLNSVIDDGDTDYHAALKAQGLASSRDGSSRGQSRSNV